MNPHKTDPRTGQDVRMPHVAQIASVAKAFAHPARVAIITFLISREVCVAGDIVDEVGLAQSTVSEHLRILKASGIVRGRIEYPRICYSLDPGALAPLSDLLEAVAARPPEPPVCYTPRRNDPG